MVDGFGNITWWGFSPSLDLQSHNNVSDAGIDVADRIDQLTITKKGEPLNILLVGAGDSRHLLKTISQMYHHQDVQLNFYVIESSMELYARHLLFLGISLEQQKRMGLQDKTELFLELFGNSLVRQQSAEYVRRMATTFIKMVTDFDYLERKFPWLDLEQLKFKERDFLEGIFKMWRNPDPSLFEVSKIWDLRLRQHLGARYDAIPNVFDWDYNMKLANLGAGIIRGSEYARWRQTGVAFEIREGTYDTPNNTLASGIVLKQDGQRHARRGYWGDFVVSPYLAYGIESEDQSFFKKANKQFIKSARDVSEFNILSMMYELANKEKYQPPEPTPQPATEANKGATLTEITEEDEEEELEPQEETVADPSAPSNPLDSEYEPMTLENVKVTFLPLGSAAEIHKKAKYHKCFHLVYMGNSVVHHLTPDLSNVFADKCHVITETAKFMLELKAEQIPEFSKKVKGLAESAGCKELSPCDPTKDAFARFVYERS